MTSKFCLVQMHVHILTHSYTLNVVHSKDIVFFVFTLLHFYLNDHTYPT